MRTLVERTGARSGLAVILLSGSYSVPEDFVREGFVAAAQAHGLAAEIVMAEVRAAYFSDASVVQRIRQHAVEPAKARGAGRLWLVGISLGGLAALAFAARHREGLERMGLLAPYPGTRDVQREIDAAGGLARWQPRLEGDDPEREAWLWLRDGAGGMPVECHLATGDRFVEGQRRMAACLPQAALHERPGGHDWKDWRSMWIDFLTRNAR